MEGILNSWQNHREQISQMNYQVGVEGKPAAKSHFVFFGQTGTIEEMTRKIQETLPATHNHYGEQNWWQSDKRLKTWYRLF